MKQLTMSFFYIDPTEGGEAYHPNRHLRLLRLGILGHFSSWVPNALLGYFLL